MSAGRTWKGSVRGSAAPLPQGARGAKPSAMEKALDAWGPHMPDWIDTLAKTCDRSSQRKVAALLGVSPAVINLLINNKYAPRSHVEMEERVRFSALMMTIVACPVLGVIGRPDCQREQAKPLVTVNPLSVQLFRACRDGCEFFEGKEHM